MNGKLYLKNFVFPVYEWYFLLLLFVTAENHPETRDKTTHEKLLILQQLLADYIEDLYCLITAVNTLSVLFISRMTSAADA